MILIQYMFVKCSEYLLTVHYLSVLCAEIISNVNTYWQSTGPQCCKHSGSEWATQHYSSQSVAEGIHIPLSNTCIKVVEGWQTGERESVANSHSKCFLMEQICFHFIECIHPHRDPQGFSQSVSVMFNEV